MAQLPYSIAILAGGESRRMGRNKALLEIEGQSILRRVIDALQGLSTNLVLVTNTPQLYRSFGLQMVSDVIPNKAALGGIYTAIYQAKDKWTLVVGCDMPFLDATVIQRLASHLQPGDNIVCPLNGTTPEPLHAFYHKRCLPLIKKHLDGSQLKINTLFTKTTTRYVQQSVLISDETAPHPWLNMNTPEDYKVVKALLKPDSHL